MYKGILSITDLFIFFWASCSQIRSWENWHCQCTHCCISVTMHLYNFFPIIWQLFHPQLLSWRCFTRIHMGLACIKKIVIHHTCHYYSSVLCLRDVNIINLALLNLYLSWFVTKKKIWMRSWRGNFMHKDKC